MNKKEKIIYIVLKTFIRLFSYIPKQKLIKVALPIGRLWFYIDIYHRKIIKCLPSLLLLQDLMSKNHDLFQFPRITILHFLLNKSSI